MKYPQLVSVPSAVSDWLDEQLEARGIDSVVYTRYILSLFRRDSVDSVRPEQDLQLTYSEKDIKRSGGRKRLRRSNEGIDSVDLDQLKRTAAVECLMSASDQKCGIETLVDELCQRLKETQSETIENIPPINSSRNNRHQDPTKQYYAAFPALAGNKTSPIIVASKRSPKKRSVAKCLTYDDKPHADMKACSAGKNKIGMGRGKKTTAKLADTEAVNIWDTYLFNEMGTNKRKGGEEEQTVEDDQGWNDDDDMHMYNENLLDDIRELLISPEPQDDSVEMMNLANVRESKGNKYILNGTSITSSIWSNQVNEEKEKYNTGDLLGMRFSSISIDPTPDIWQQNESNSFLESFRSGLGMLNFDDGAWKAAEKWAEPDRSLSELDLSLRKINHDEERSLFRCVGKRSSAPIQEVPCKPTPVYFPPKDEMDREDLLTSEKTHFRPVSERSGRLRHVPLDDGMTFVILSGLEEINYTRSDSGMLYMDTEYGTLKKYKEYKPADGSEFVVKFNFCQNDKSCQTDFGEEDAEPFVCSEGVWSEPKNDFFFPGDDEEKMDDCKCDPSLDDACRPGSLTGEFGWKNETERCDKCKESWNNGRNSDKLDDMLGFGDIWGGDVCNVCLEMTKANIVSIKKNTLLREEVHHDGELLFADLNILQQSYNEMLPAAEVSCDLGELLGNKDRKRRHSFVTGLYGEAVSTHQGSWSFASRLKQDCLIQMSTIPTLRSVTL